jgi:hypothetical protein
MTNTTTHRASCHCRKIQIEVQLDLSKGATRCNCSICHRIGSSGGAIKPADLRVLTDESTFAVYPNAIGARYFCPTCGIHVYGRGNLPELGGEFVSVNYQCLEDVDVNTLPIKFWDGRHDNWHAGLRDQPWPIFADA